ncbi:MAG: hypothetical protein K0Q97_2558 [Bacillota bacterium]|jgi:hypothetical protein|nr:hypothetical protein [Bacillota bacterium]
MDIDLRSIIQILIPILTIIFGFLSAYFKQNDKLKCSAIKYITEAEEMYKDVSKAGGTKFAWVVDILYNLVPNPLKFLFTKKVIEAIVQSTFDGIEAYAKTQLDKSADKMLDQ